jgi:hypothetical protein
MLPSPLSGEQRGERRCVVRVLGKNAAYGCGSKTQLVGKTLRESIMVLGDRTERFSAMRGLDDDSIRTRLRDHTG